MAAKPPHFVHSCVFRGSTNLSTSIRQLMSHIGVIVAAMNPAEPAMCSDPVVEIASKFRDALQQSGYTCVLDGLTLKLSSSHSIEEAQRMLQLIRHARLSTSAPDLIEGTPAIRITDSTGNLLHRSQPIMAELMVEILKSSRLTNEVTAVYCSKPTD